MKRLVFTLLALCIAFAGFAQTMYWTAYNMKVKNGDDAKVLSAIDNFMNSETGKTMPPAALTSKLFSNSEQDFTHQVIFISPDKTSFGKMYSGTLQQSADFQLLGATLDHSTSNVGSYLGKSVDMSAASNGNYNTVVSLSVTDPATYISEFKKFAAAIKAQWGGKVGIALHRVLSGNEEGVTHIAVIDAPDFETLLDFSDQVYSSSFFASFNMKVKDIRSPVSNFSTVTLKRYNAPE